MKQAPIALIKALCEAVDIDSDNVAQILIDPNQVTFRVVTTIDDNPALKDVQVPICACQRG